MGEIINDLCHELHEFKRICTNDSSEFVQIRAIRDQNGREHYVAATNRSERMIRVNSFRSVQFVTKMAADITLQRPTVLNE